MWKVPLFKPAYGPEERNAVMEAFDYGWLAMGKYTQGFEKKFSGYLKTDRESLAVSSCTAALHMALLSAGIGPGDEVIISALTFVADLNVIVMAGAKPVIADVSSTADWNLSVENIEKKITARTRAIIAVHFAGYPFDPGVRDLARKRKILLIEDCAHSIGASVDGERCGTWGDMAAFSFYANKNVAVGEGGMFLSSSDDFTTRAKLLRSHGMTALSLERSQGRTISYDVVMPGLNYRISELNSALGIVQLKKLDASIRIRKNLVKQYVQKLAESPLEIPFLNVPAGVKPAYHIFPVLLPPGTDRKKIMEFLRQKKIQTSIHYPSFRQFTYYSDRLKDKTPVADEISSRVLTLPLYPAMTPEDVVWVCRWLKAAIVSP